MVNHQPTAAGVRLAEVIGSLSLVTDLATEQPLEHGLRRAMLSVWLGEDLGLSSEGLSDAYYVALLGSRPLGNVTTLSEAKAPRPEDGFFASPRVTGSISLLTLH